MNSEKEYKRIRSFFITLFSITSVFIAIILFFTYQDVKSLRDEYKERYNQHAELMSSLSMRSDEVIEEMKSELEYEIQGMRYSIKNLSTEEARNRINEVFQYGNVELMVEAAAEEAISNEIDRILDERIQETEKKIVEITEMSIDLMFFFDGIGWGNQNVLDSLISIIYADSTSVKGKLAKRIIEAESDDLRKLCYTIHGTNVDTYLSMMKIPNNRRENETDLINAIFDYILRKDQLPYEVAIGVIALEYLGFEQITILDLNQVKKLRTNYNQNHK